MDYQLKKNLLVGILASGFLVFFPDPNRPSEVKDVSGLPAKVSKARVMRLKSQQTSRPKTKLNDQDDATDQVEDAVSEDSQQ